jgi:hypothetical protein
MNIVNFPDAQFNQIGASGQCPHCAVTSLFKPVASYVQRTPQSASLTVVSATQCESCKQFALVIGQTDGQNHPSRLIAFYPLGKPRDAVDLNVPKPIANDFAEALRCQWIQAHRACVVMCRRAVQSSALQLGAKGGKLIDQIDDLSKTGIITTPLKEFAHEIRLTGNDGAHPDKDGLEDVTEKDGEAIIEFTREYLHHVYVMPAKLAARRNSPVASS